MPPHLTSAVLIAPHTLPAAVETLRTAALWLEQHGCRPMLEAQSSEAIGPHAWPIVSREGLGAAADVVVAFGGDGTLLDAARAVAQSGGDAPLWASTSDSWDS